MKIVLSNVGKRFNRDWIFRGFNYAFVAPKRYAITGSNGSGKSTLLQVISGALTFSEGTVEAFSDTASNQYDQLYRNISIAAPYLELIEEMTALELLAFHESFKPLSIPHKEALQLVQLEKAANKQIRYYSSGMKQRLKLAQALFCKSPVLLLDEPTTNLDAEGTALYHQLIQHHSNNKLVIISSNDPNEYAFCDEVISIADYK